MKAMVVGLLLAIVCATGEAVAQTAEGSIRGYVKDQQGNALPGVTITATSPGMPTPRTGVTDQEGYYRLLNVPPGNYSVTAELQGVSRIVRANIEVRAGLNLGVDLSMQLGTFEETLQVVGETPLLATSQAVQSVNVSGDLAQSLPLGSQKHWS